MGDLRIARVLQEQPIGHAPEQGTGGLGDPRLDAVLVGNAGRPSQARKGSGAALRRLRALVGRPLGRLDGPDRREPVHLVYQRPRDVPRGERIQAGP